MSNHNGLSRIFWTWDHCTNWTLNERGNQNCGSGNAYTKHPEVFLQDYKRMVDWCAANQIDAIGIVGLLRDRHGGLEIARELCAYAREKGVFVYIIAGLYAYGGIYYEGNHKYCLDRFLEKNPDCAARDAKGHVYRAKFYSPAGGTTSTLGGCPSNPLLKEYVLESLEWLFKSIPELGGIQMEVGDVGVCHCPKCMEKAARSGQAGSISFDAMGQIYPDAARTVLRTSPDAWVICETYHHFMPHEIDEGRFGCGVSEESLQKLTGIPEGCFLQWVCDHSIKDGSWDDTARISPTVGKYRHIMRAHFGTYWSGHTRAALEVEKIRRQCRYSHLSGLHGVSPFGESSPFHPNAEFNYLALSYFSEHPLAPLSDFADEVMAPRLGGKGPAEKYLAFAPAYQEPAMVPEIQREIIRILASLKEYDAIRRWQYLASFLNSFHWEAQLPNYRKGTIIRTTQESDL